MADELTLSKERAIYAITTLKDSWVLCLKQFFPLFGAWAAALAVPVLIFVTAIITGLIMSHSGAGQTAAWTAFGLMVSSALMMGCLWAGWALVTLKVVRGLAVKVSDLIRPLGQVVSGLVVLVLTSVCIGVLAPLVVPGALLFLKWQLAPYYIIDRNYGPLEALKASWNDTNRVFIPLAILDLMFVGLSMATSFTLFGPVLCHIALAVASALVYNNWLADESHPDLRTNQIE